MITIALVFLPPYGSLALASLVAGAVLGPLSVLRSGLRRRFMVGVNLLDLLCLFLLYFNAFTTLVAYGPPRSNSTIWALYSIAVALFIMGFGLSLSMLARLGWVEAMATLLPVRGVHARRLLAAAALFGLLGPLFVAVVAWSWWELGRSHPRNAWLGVGSLPCTALYFSPAWLALARDRTVDQGASHGDIPHGESLSARHPEEPVAGT